MAHQEHSQQCEDEAKEDDHNPSSSLRAQAGIRLPLGANTATDHVMRRTKFLCCTDGRLGALQKALATVEARMAALSGEEH